MFSRVFFDGQEKMEIFQPISKRLLSPGLSVVRFALCLISHRAGNRFENGSFQTLFKYNEGAKRDENEKRTYFY